MAAILFLAGYRVFDWAWNKHITKIIFLLESLKHFLLYTL